MALKWITILIVGLFWIQAAAGETSVLGTPKDKMSYALGVDIGRNLRQQAIETDIDLLIRGVEDHLSGGKPLFTEKDLQIAMTAFQVELGWKGTETKRASSQASYGMGIDVGRKLKVYDIQVDPDLVAKGLRDLISQAPLLTSEKDLQTAMASFQLIVKRSQSKISRLARDTKRGSEALFLAENRKKEGIVVLPSGLQYKVLRDGEGRKPKEGDILEVHYRGTFIDGTEFGNSYASPRPVRLRATEGLPGLNEALRLMPTGSKWQLFLPSKLAFRPRGWGISGWPTLPLVFEIELLAIH
jgi:FKBP-type peptidyl-prolyl cis-trans isomerase